MNFKETNLFNLIVGTYDTVIGVIILALIAIATIPCAIFVWPFCKTYSRGYAYAWRPMILNYWGDGVKRVVWLKRVRQTEMGWELA